MNQKLFHLLHVAPGKPLQTEEAEKPSQTLGTGARRSRSLHCLQADRGKYSHLLLGQLHPRLLVPCLHTNLFLAALQVSAWPALGLVLSKPTWCSFNLGGSAAASKCAAVQGQGVSSGSLRAYLKLSLITQALYVGMWKGNAAVKRMHCVLVYERSCSNRLNLSAVLHLQVPPAVSRVRKILC